MTTFDEPDGVQRWESDSRRIFGKGFGPKVYKRWLFSKARVSVIVRVRVSFSRCEMTTFDEPDGSNVGKVIQEEFLEKVLDWAQSVQKVDFFQNLGLALGLRLGLGLAFQVVK